MEYLLDRLVEWLNDPIFVNDDPEIQFALIVAKAFYAHLHVAWIHPFGDGDGRTARLVASPAAQLLREPVLGA